MPPADPDVVTTTVFDGAVPTDSPPSTSGSAQQLPIGAIVGGIVGGVVLALIVVFGWIWWRRAREREARKQYDYGQTLPRSAMRGSTTASASASHQSLPRTPRMMMAGTNPMANMSQKSVTFAPSPRTSDDESERKGVPLQDGVRPDARPSFERRSTDPLARTSPDARAASRTSLDRRPGASSLSLDRPVTSRPSLDRTKTGTSSTSLPYATKQSTSSLSLPYATPYGSRTELGTPDPPPTPPRSVLRPPPPPSRPARSPLADSYAPPVQRARLVRAERPPLPLPPGASRPVPQPTAPPLPPPAPAVPRRLTRPPPVSMRQSTATVGSTEVSMSVASMYSQDTASDHAEALLRAGLSMPRRDAPTMTRMQ